MLFYSSVGWLKQLHFFFKVQLSAFRVYDKIKSAYSIPLQFFILKCIFLFLEITQLFTLKVKCRFGDLFTIAYKFTC